jgi:hydrogenase maturation factor
LLAAIRPEKLDEAIRILNSLGIQTAVIGQFTKKNDPVKIIKKDGKTVHITEPVIDELWKLIT